MPEPADPATKAAGAEPAAAEAVKDSEAVASENCKNPAAASVQQQPASDADNVANVQEKDEAAKDVKVTQTFPLQPLARAFLSFCRLVRYC